MRMTPEEFHSWSQRLQLSKTTEALIATIRSSPPVRRVSGCANNITGRYPSPKMGMSIQFESERVELWAIYTMERDDDVLEFYEQSSRIPLSYHAKSGHKTTQWHTPDFFLLRRTSAGWEEWKQASALETEEVLTQTMPHPAKRVSLEMEARAGEHKVALHDSEGAKQFQALLKKACKSGKRRGDANARKQAKASGGKHRGACLGDTPSAASFSQTHLTSCRSTRSRA